MSTVMIDSEQVGSTPPRSAECAQCGERWPAVLATCPQCGTALLLCEPVAPGLGPRVGEYVITGVIGSGGMSTVYAGEHPVIGKKVAIKVMAAELSSRREAVLRFMQEARSVNQIGHPNVVDIFSFGTLPDGRCYQVMEWLPGETLGQRLYHGALSFAAKVDVICQVCDALEAVHAHGFVHRDLKPDNIFLMSVEDDRLLVKLLDFGIAKLLSPEGPDRPGLTRPDLTLGTPEYVSPEQVRGRPVEPRSDVYSLGVVMFELFVGQLPFEADSTFEWMVKHAGEKPLAPSACAPGIAPALDRLLQRMLAKRPEDRPHVTQVRDELRAVLRAASGEHRPAREPALLPAPRPPRRWAPRLLVAGFVGVLLAGGASAPASPAAPAPAPTRVASSAPPPAAVAPVPVPVPMFAAPPPAAPPPAVAPPPRSPQKVRARLRARPPAPAPSPSLAAPRVDEESLVDPFAETNGTVTVGTP